MEEEDSIFQPVYEWIITCLNIEPNITDDLNISDKFYNLLRTGEVLCNLANFIAPGSVRKIHKIKESSGSFQMSKFLEMENITTFLSVCRKTFEVPEKDLFSTIDLHEKKDLKQVARSLFALGGIIQSREGYDGPILGIARKKT